MFLANALLSLMRQKPYEKINIKEICSNAFLSRTSFYKYFSSKDELLRYQFRLMFGSAAKHGFSAAPAVRFADCLYRLKSYTEIISEQRLLAFLLPDIAAVTNEELHCEKLDLFSVCAEYISTLFAVRTANGASPETVVQYLQAAKENKPEMSRNNGQHRSDSSRHTVTFAKALVMQLEKGISLHDIRVKELTAAAEINRSSFYRSFRGIQELFMHSIRSLILEELSSSLNDDETILLHYRPYKPLFNAAWQELGLEDSALLYASVINELTLLPNDDIPPEQVYIARLRNICLAARRTALLYCFL